MADGYSYLRFSEKTRCQIASGNMNIVENK